MIKKTKDKTVTIAPIVCEIPTPNPKPSGATKIYVEQTAVINRAGINVTIYNFLAPAK